MTVLEAILATVMPRPGGNTTVSWLPLSHDMGLIVGAEIVRPATLEQFVELYGRWAVLFEPAAAVGDTVSAAAVARGAIAACGHRPDEVVAVERGQLRYTSLGKRQRRLLTQSLLAGDLRPA